MPNDPDGAAGTETPETPETPDPATPETPDTGGGNGDGEKDWQSEADKWKALARKHEGQAKANAAAAKELEEFKAAQMSETEKAIAEAEARGRTAATSEVGQKLAAAEIKAALTGVVTDPAAIVEDLNLARYVRDDGEVDDEAVGRLRAKYEGIAGKPGRPGSADGGTRGGTPGPPQLSRDDLKNMSPKQIIEAKAQGRLRDLLSGKAS